MKKNEPNAHAPGPIDALLMRAERALALLPEPEPGSYHAELNAAKIAPVLGEIRAYLAERFAPVEWARALADGGISHADLGAAAWEKARAVIEEGGAR